eukprot:Gb_24168 [translate_table: standard]
MCQRMADSLHSPLLNEDQQIGIGGDGGEGGGPGKAIDTPPITTFRQFRKESWIEIKKLWTIAAPAIITTLLQYSIGSVTQIFAGHLGTLELASTTIANGVIGGLAFGIMLGMGSGLETLCGQAFGAGQSNMLGVYMQRGVWTGLSWLAFRDLWAFVRLSVASAVMLCMNLNGWEAMIFIGFNAAISVRVSNELGAGRPRAAKFAVIIVVVTALLIGIAAMVAILIAKDRFAVIYTDSKVVMKAVSGMAFLLSVTMVLNSVQPVLSGVAVGGGWQALIAYINIGCYYVIGLPLGLLLGYKLDLGVKGIWGGMIGGTALQTLILLGITYFTNWNREAAQAKDRLRVWGGAGKDLKDGVVNVSGRVMKTVKGRVEGRINP